MAIFGGNQQQLQQPPITAAAAATRGVTSGGGGVAWRKRNQSQMTMLSGGVEIVSYDITSAMVSIVMAAAARMLTKYVASNNGVTHRLTDPNSHLVIMRKVKAASQYGSTAYQCWRMARSCKMVAWQLMAAAMS